MPLRDKQDAPGVRQPALDVRERARGVTVVSGRRAQAGDHGVLVEILLAGNAFWPVASREPIATGCGRGRSHGRGAGVERADRPPRQPDLGGSLTDLRDRAVGSRAEVDRGAAAERRRAPGRIQELLARPHQLGGAGADPFRVAHQHVRPGGQFVEHQHHPVGQHRRERLHAIHRSTVRDLVKDIDELGVGARQFPGTGPDLRREQQLPAWRREQLTAAALGGVRGVGQCPLIRHGERPDVLDLVAEELNP